MADPTPDMGHWVLNTPINDADSGATTIREYLIALARIMWQHGEGANGKRPFGNSGWQWDVYAALVKADLIEGTFVEDGGLVEADTDKGDELIADALRVLATP